MNIKTIMGVSFASISGWGMKLTMNVHLVLKVEREGTYTHITLLAFMA
jgi:hypothetical protein